MIPRFGAKWLVLVLLFSVTGCALQPHKQVQEPAAWPAQRDKLKSILGWKISGRLYISDAKKGWNLQFTWEQHDDFYLITLRDPLGRQLAVMKGSPSWVRLTDANQVEYKDRNPESLLFRVTGYRMPVGNLQHWILGLPIGSAADDLVWNEQGRLSAFEEDGWTLEYKKYSSVAAPVLPEKLFLKRSPYQVKVVVSDWSQVSFR